MLLLLSQEIKCDLQGTQVSAIAIINNRAMIDPALQFQPHGDRRQLLQFHADPVRLLPEMQQSADTMQYILDGSLVRKWDCKREIPASKHGGNGSRTTHLLQRQYPQCRAFMRTPGKKFGAAASR